MKPIIELASKLINDDSHYENKIVGYVDLLGFSEKLLKAKGLSDFQPLICKLQEIKCGIDCKDTVHAFWFSDCCYIWAEPKYIHDFMVCMSCLCRDLLAMTISHEGLTQYTEVANFLFRGGITYGGFFSLEEYVAKHNISLSNPVQVFLGPAVVQAHDLEDKYACDPRIVIDDNFKKHIENNYQSFKNTEFLIQDSDGIEYFDYLSFLINEMNESLPNEIELVFHWAEEKKTTVNPKLKSKYNWLVEYLKKYVDKA